VRRALTGGTLSIRRAGSVHGASSAVLPSTRDAHVLLEDEKTIEHDVDWFVPNTAMRTKYVGVQQRGVEVGEQPRPPAPCLHVLPVARRIDEVRRVPDHAVQRPFEHVANEARPRRAWIARPSPVSTHSPLRPHSVGPVSWQLNGRKHSRRQRGSCAGSGNTSTRLRARARQQPNGSPQAPAAAEPEPRLRAVFLEGRGAEQACAVSTVSSRSNTAALFFASWQSSLRRRWLRADRP